MLMKNFKRRDAENAKGRGAGMMKHFSGFFLSASSATSAPLRFTLRIQSKKNEP